MFECVSAARYKRFSMTPWYFLTSFRPFNENPCFSCRFRSWGLILPLGFKEFCHFSPSSPSMACRTDRSSSFWAFVTVFNVSLSNLRHFLSWCLQFCCALDSFTDCKYFCELLSLSCTDNLMPISTWPDSCKNAIPITIYIKKYLKIALFFLFVEMSPL